jgi:tol-pal system protein YbgF
MDHLNMMRNGTGILIAFILMMVPACGTFGPKKEDPEVTTLKREMRQVERSNALNQQSLEGLYDRLNTLEDQLEEMKSILDKRTKPPQTVQAPPKAAPSPPKPTSQVVVKKAEPPATKKTGRPPTRKKTSVKKKVETSLKQTSEKEYNRAYSAYAEQRYDESLALFKAFHGRYPKHDLADNAQYWIGEIYYDIEDYPNAILAFKEVVTKYGDQNKAPDALLKIGFCYMALDDPNNARIFLKRVIKNYPFSTAEAKARTKLKEIENL